MASASLLLSCLVSCSTDDLIADLTVPDWGTVDSAVVDISPIGKLLTIIDSDGNEVSEFSEKYGEYRLIVNTSGKWHLKSSNDAFIKPLREEGEGVDTVTLLVGCNWGEARHGDLRLVLDKEQVDSLTSFARPRNVDDSDSESLYIYQGASLQNVHKMFSSNKGAGYSYMPNSNYCFGTNLEIFNLQLLDSLNTSSKADLFFDEVYPEVEQEVITSDSEKGLHDQLSISASLDLDVSSFSINVSGSYDNIKDEKSKRSYAMERLKAYQFTREVNYMNIVALSRADSDFKKAAYAPGYRMLEDELISNINLSKDSTEIYEYCKNFVGLVGPTFISKSVMGCTLDYQISVLSSSLSDSLSIKGALDIKVKGSTGVEIKGSGQYDKFEKEVESSTESKVNVRGGEVMLISIISSGGTLSDGQVQKWQMSCKPELATLIDMKLIPIYSIISDVNAQRAVRNYILKTIAENEAKLKQQETASNMSVKK